MPSDTLVRSEWVERVLGIAVASSGSGSAAPSQDPNSQSAAEASHPDLAPRVRKARRDAVDALVALGDRLLGLPEVMADPRADDVRAVVARFPGLIPSADTVLTALEDFDDADDENARGTASAAALKQVKAYAAQLADQSELTALQRIAADGLGGLAACARLSATLQQCAAKLGG